MKVTQVIAIVTQRQRKGIAMASHLMHTHKFNKQPNLKAKAHKPGRLQTDRQKSGPETESVVGAMCT